MNERKHINQTHTATVPSLVPNAGNCKLSISKILLFRIECELSLRSRCKGFGFNYSPLRCWCCYWPVRACLYTVDLCTKNFRSFRELQFQMCLVRLKNNRLIACIIMQLEICLFARCCWLHLHLWSCYIGRWGVRTLDFWLMAVNISSANIKF